MSTQNTQREALAAAERDVQALAHFFDLDAALDALMRRLPLVYTTREQAYEDFYQYLCAAMRDNESTIEQRLGPDKARELRIAWREQRRRQLDKLRQLDDAWQHVARVRRALDETN